MNVDGKYDFFPVTHCLAPQQSTTCILSSANLPNGLDFESIRSGNKDFESVALIFLRCYHTRCTSRYEPMGLCLSPAAAAREARSDSFQYTPADYKKTSLSTAPDIHENKIVYLLVFCLHAQCHLPFRACNAVLVCLALIFKSAGVVLEPPMYSTLPSVMTALRADPILQVCPVRPTCQKVYPPSTSVVSDFASCKMLCTQS